MGKGVSHGTVSEPFIEAVEGALNPVRERKMPLVRCDCQEDVRHSVLLTNVHASLYEKHNGQIETAATRSWSHNLSKDLLLKGRNMTTSACERPSSS